MGGTSDSLGSTASLQRRKTAYLAKFEVCNIQNLMLGKATKERKKIQDGPLWPVSPFPPSSAPGGYFSICSRCCPDTFRTQVHPSALEQQQQHWMSHHTRTEAVGPTTQESPVPAPLGSPQGPPQAAGGCTLLRVCPRGLPQPA